MKKKIAKFILLVVCGLVAYAAISAVLRAREEKKLKQEIADIRRTLREQGFKTEFDDFKVTTDPAMRARVAALTALGYEPKLNTNGDVLDFRPIISNGTAKVIWKQDSLTLGTNAYQWADFRAALNKEQARLDAACEAALAGPIQSDLNFVNHVAGGNTDIVYLHHLSRTLGNRVILDLRDGNPDAAWTNLLAATRLVTAWNVEPVPISHVMRLWMADDTLALTWQALQFNHWPDDRLSTLQSEWESADFFTNLPEMMALARVQDEEVCQDLSKLPLSGIFVLSQFKWQFTKSPRAAYQDINYDVQQALYRGNNALRDEKNLLLYFRDRELELRQAVHSPTWAQMRAQPGVTNIVPFKSPSPDVMTWVKPDSPAKSLWVASAAVAEAERRILITAVALERCREKYGSYPETLAKLAPEFLKNVPADFMDGQPLRYRPIADGHFLLYSVGLDCVDDGGKQQSPNAPRFLTSSHGTYSVLTNVDIVWPVPATP